jgi:hypothetical protein
MPRWSSSFHSKPDWWKRGLSPRRKIPIWFGGHAEMTMQRVIEFGGGWMPMAYAPGDEAKAAFDKLRAMADKADRDPASIGIGTRTTVALGAEAEWRDTIRFWKSCGATHITLVTYSGRGHLPHRGADAWRPSRCDQTILECGRRSSVRLPPASEVRMLIDHPASAEASPQRVG